MLAGWSLRHSRGARIWSQLELQRCQFCFPAGLQPKMTKCELGCSFIVGAICKPVAAKTPGPIWAKEGSYLACEIAVEIACREACNRNKEPCAAKQ